MSPAIDLCRYGSRAEALHSLGLRGFVSAVVRGFQRSVATQREREEDAAGRSGSRPAAMPASGV